MSVKVLFILTFTYLFTFTFGLLDQQPQQVHLALGPDSSTSLTVTWVTQDELDEEPRVEYGQVKANSPFNFPLTQTGVSSKFVDGGSEGRTMYIHRVYLSSLKENTRYYYHVGSSQGWSNIYFFKSLPQWSPVKGLMSGTNLTVALYGDLGNENAQSIARLEQEVAKGSLDLIIHLGDFAYDLHEDNGRVGDEFMKQIEPIAAYVPYQVVVGDHEAAYNFSHFNSRFTMVDSLLSNVDPKEGGVNNHFYSFNVGPVHFIAFSTEFYFSVEYGWTQIATQYSWLEADLKEANKPQNRKERPWIITLAHRPMYCSSNYSKCLESGRVLRTGLPLLHSYGLEELFFKYTVDVEIFSHQHVYERLFPLYNETVFKGSLNDPYVNPRAPVHLITGSAGSKESLSEPSLHSPEWSALRIFDYGYTRMYISNSTHITFQQVSDDQEGKIVDSFTIVKDHHKPYPIPNWNTRTDETHSKIVNATTTATSSTLVTPKKEEKKSNSEKSNSLATETSTTIISHGETVTNGSITGPSSGEKTLGKEMDIQSKRKMNQRPSQA